MALLVIFGFFMIFVVFGVVALLRAVFFGSMTYIKTTPKTVHATVLDKRKQDMLRQTGVYTNYFVYFQLSETDKIELSVGKRIYSKASPGKTGLLTYKGNVFRDFIFDEDTAPKQQKETYVLNGEVIEK